MATHGRVSLILTTTMITVVVKIHILRCSHRLRRCQAQPRVKAAGPQIVTQALKIQYIAVIITKFRQNFQDLRQTVHNAVLVVPTPLLRIAHYKRRSSFSLSDKDMGAISQKPSEKTPVAQFLVVECMTSTVVIGYTLENPKRLV